MSLFVDALYELWYFDLATRRRYQVGIIVLAFLYGVFNSLVLGRDESRVTWETLGLIGVLTIGSSVFYCLKKAGAFDSAYAKLHGLLDHRGFLEVGFTSVALIACIALARYLPSNRVEAFSLNSQLRTVAYSAPFAPSTAKMAAEVFEKASVDRVPLNANLVGTASEKLLSESRSNPGAWPAVLGALSYRSGVDIEAAPSYRINEGCIVPASETAVTFTMARLSIIGCDGQALDGLRLIDVAFKNSTIIYHGGPTELQNVHFENCKFLLDYSPAAHALARTLATSTSNVTITLPGNSGKILK